MIDNGPATDLEKSSYLERSISDIAALNDRLRKLACALAGHTEKLTIMLSGPISKDNPSKETVATEPYSLLEHLKFYEYQMACLEHIADALCALV